MFHRKIGNALFLLARIDILMKNENWPSWRRKQFWTDFIKSPAYREQAFRQIYKNLEITEDAK